MNKEVIVFQALDRLKDHTGMNGTWTQQHNDVDGEVWLTIKQILHLSLPS